MIRLFSRYWSVPAALSLTVEGLLLYLAVPFATYLRLGIGPGSPPAHSAVVLEGLSFTAVGLLSLYINGLYDFGERLPTRRMVVCLSRAFTLGALALCVFYFLVPTAVPGRGVFFIAFLFAVPGVVAWRFLLRVLLKSDSFAERVLIVGTDEKAIDIARETLARRHLGYRVVGFLDDYP